MLCAAFAASAQEDEPKSEKDVRAKIEKLHREGNSLMKKSRYKAAYDVMRQILPLARIPDDQLLYNLGMLGESLGDCRAAVLYFNGFLYLAPGDKSAAEAEQKRAGCLKRAGATGRLEVNTEAQGAEVWVDHVLVGRAPAHDVRLPAGSWRLLVRHPAYRDRDEAFTIDDGGVTKLDVKLDKLIFKGNLKVTAEPADGTVVYLDNIKMGAVPYATTGLDTRRYLLRIEKDGWDRWVRYINIEKDQTLDIKAVLEKTGANVPIPPLPEQ